MDDRDNFEIFMDALLNMPFNKALTLKPESFDFDNECIRFSMRDELLGNPVYNILHGGVISAILDLEGMFILALRRADEAKALSPESLPELYKGATLDLRVDYLQPGTGRQFVASGHILHMGKKAAVVRMELQNDQQQLIAVATGTYIIG